MTQIQRCAKEAQSRRMSFSIRCALPCDAPMLARAILAEANAAGPMTVDRQTIAVLVQHLLDDPACRIVVASDEFGDFAGTAIVTGTEISAANRAWYLSFVSVDRDVRRSGVFRMLCTRLSELARREHIDEIRALITPENATAVSAFLRVGFEPCPNRGMCLDLAKRLNTPSETEALPLP